MAVGQEENLNNGLFIVWSRLFLSEIQSKLDQTPKYCERFFVESYHVENIARYGNSWFEKNNRRKLYSWLGNILSEQFIQVKPSSVGFLR